MERWEQSLRKEKSVQKDQSVSQMAQEVLIRQAKALAQRSGHSLKDARQGALPSQPEPQEEAPRVRHGAHLLHLRRNVAHRGEHGVGVPLLGWGTAILGLSMIAAEFYAVARLMDRLEVRAREVLEPLGKAFVRMPTWAQLWVSMLIRASTITLVYGLYSLSFG